MSSSTLRREGGRLVDVRDGALTGLRGRPFELAALEAPDGVRNPVRLNFEGGGPRGDSARGSEGRLTGRGVRTAGLRPGPTDLLKLMGREGVGGFTLGILGADKRFVTYLLLFMGTKMPDPGVEVEKYFFPSTSPLFFPRLACSAASSMPANFPGLPATPPRYFIVPYIPPGTFTRSPTWMSSRGAIRVSRK